MHYLGLLFVSLSLIVQADSCRTLSPEQQPLYCDNFGLQYENDKCCGESDSWAEDQRAVEYTLVNNQDPLDNPLAMSQFCRLWGIEKFGWNIKQNRYLCAGQSNGEWLPDQQIDQFTNPTMDVTLAPAAMSSYCKKWGISSFAWVSSRGHYSCAGMAEGPWLPNVAEMTYQTPSNRVIDSPDVARDYCQQWGFSYFAYYPAGKTYTCLLASPQGMWAPNQTSVQYTIKDNQLTTPEAAKEFCQQYGFSKFAYSTHINRYSCYGPNSYNWHPDGICYNGINLYPTLEEAKMHCMQDGFSFVKEGGYRCCT